MATSNMKRLLIVVYICTFSLMTPLGIAMGIALTHVSMEGSSTRTVEVAVLNGLAVGSLLYVVFFEILEKERSKKTNGLLQVLFSNKSRILREVNFVGPHFSQLVYSRSRT